MKKLFDIVICVILFVMLSIVTILFSLMAIIDWDGEWLSYVFATYQERLPMDKILKRNKSK